MAKVSFKTKDGKRVSFNASTFGGKSKSTAKTRRTPVNKKPGLSRADRARLSRAAKKRPRFKTGPKKGQFKKVR